MSITAMKQALEALKDIQDFKPNDKTAAAITTLRTAIEQAEKQEPDPCKEGTCECCWAHLDEPAAQPAPVQEPVTDAQKRAAFERFWVTEIGDKDDLTYGGLGYAINRVAVAWEAWKAAAQRQWVSLTDEEIMEVNGIHDDPKEWPEVISEARAIEAKLREKNT